MTITVMTHYTAAANPHGPEKLGNREEASCPCTD